jgi:signal recognition particle receptor subunit beta
MSMINYASREINCKLVYYGPGLGGKTTNLEHVYGKVNPNARGKLISLATETERKLILKGVDGVVFVADSQLERMEANIESMQNLYDNMAEYGYDLTKIPFVVQYNKRDLPNAAPLKDLQAALNPGWQQTDPARQKVTPDPAIPGEFLVHQLPTGEWVERAPIHEAVAVTGDGVFETLKTCSKLVLKSLG